MGERHQLSGLSGVLYVDLINTANKIDRPIKLQLANGLAWGDIALPDTLPAGDYRVRGYTRWMLNEDCYFEQVIPVGSLQSQKVPEHSTAKAVSTKPDLQFFPEGGQFVAGLPAKIAFKAIGVNGLGIGVKGSVTDNLGKVICQLESSHLGMCFINFTP